MSTPLNVATAGHIQIWTINRPDVGNAITGLDIIEALEEAVYAANADTEVRAVILTGEGRIFSAGGNVKDMADRQGMFGVDERAQRRAYVAGIQRIPRAMQRLEVPIIAAVNGAAIGAGLDLAMMCDLRVASDRASPHLWELHHLGDGAAAAEEPSPSLGLELVLCGSGERVGLSWAAGHDTETAADAALHDRLACVLSGRCGKALGSWLFVRHNGKPFSVRACLEFQVSWHS